MNTCKTCGGRDGAHYLCCLVGRVAERVAGPLVGWLLGPGYAWRAPEPPALDAVVRRAQAAVDDVIARDGTLGEAQRAAREHGARLEVELDTDESYPDHGEEDDRAAATGAPSVTAGTAEPTHPGPRGREKAVPAAAEAPPPPVQTGHDARQRHVAEAHAWLLDYLTGRDGSALFTELIAAGEEAGFSQSTLRTAAAKPDSPVVRASTKTFPRRSYWALRDTPAPEVAAPVVPEPSAAPAAPPPPPPRLRSRGAAFEAKRQEVAERGAALDLFIETHVVPAGKVGAFLTVPQIAEAYEAWRPTIDAPALGSSADIGYAMKRAGYWRSRRQARPGDIAPDGERFGSRSKPMLYFRVALAPTEEEGGVAGVAPSNVVAIHEPDNNNDDDVAELRQLMRRAQAQRGPRIVRPSYDGDLPGRELKDPKYREMVTKLIDQGWTYRKTNGNGKGKPRVINPRGHAYALCNTPSDVRGHLNARSQLRHMGAAL